MLARATAIYRQIMLAGDKLEWLRDRLAWRRFDRGLRREIARNADFDRTHGTDTADDIPLEQAGLTPLQASRGNSICRALWEENFQAILDDLPLDFRRFTFIDIGSGKGKLLLLASHHPFRRVLGIELAPLLHQIALRNLALYRSLRQCCPYVSISTRAFIIWKAPGWVWKATPPTSLQSAGQVR